MPIHTQNTSTDGLACNRRSSNLSLNIHTERCYGVCVCAIARERCIEIEAQNLTHDDAPESYRSLSKNSVPVKYQYRFSTRFTVNTRYQCARASLSYSRVPSVDIQRVETGKSYSRAHPSMWEGEDVAIGCGGDILILGRRARSPSQKWEFLSPKVGLSFSLSGIFFLSFL